MLKLYTFSHILLGGLQREPCENFITLQPRKPENNRACTTIFLQPSVMALKIQRVGSCEILYPPSPALLPAASLASAPFSYVKTVRDAIRLYRTA
jgi:hypothetical protein